MKNETEIDTEKYEDDETLDSAAGSETIRELQMLDCQLTGARRRARGKVGRLPKPIRETVNLMIADGEPYTAVIRRLDLLGYPGFTSHNISRWKLGGHQDWAAERDRLELEKIRSDTLAEMAKDGSDPGDASEKLMALHIFRALRELQSCPAEDLLGKRAGTFLRLLRASNRQLGERTRRERLALRKEEGEDDLVTKLLADPKRLARLLGQIHVECSQSPVAGGRG